jgi:undecaprenyl-diphosphatase
VTSGRRWALLLGLGLAAVVGSHLLDPWAYHALANPAAGERDWGRMLRIIGFAPTWGLVALALWLEGSRRDAARQVTIAVVVGGLAAEALKLLIRRERPGPELEYVFRAFTDHPFSTRDLGMPSSHAMVAFAGAAAVALRFRKVGPVVFALAAGCGLTRLMAQAHFLSDVVAGALGGTVAGLIDWGRRPGGPSRGSG